MKTQELAAIGFKFWRDGSLVMDELANGDSYVIQRSHHKEPKPYKVYRFNQSQDVRFELVEACASKAEAVQNLINRVSQ